MELITYCLWPFIIGMTVGYILSELEHKDVHSTRRSKKS
jgi:hypothetical protein